jgi:5'-deoxy-5'-methylthioadenosine phosphorylase
MYAVIGGSGLSGLANVEVVSRKVCRTPYGEPSGPLTFGRIQGRDLMFLARHGYGHTIPPHEVNYRANIWALKEEGAQGVVSVASVGGIRSDLAPGTLVLPDQIIDYTWGRHSTFFEGPGATVTHVDFTQPYSQMLRSRILAAAAACGERIVEGAVYAATQGPRLETAAEIARLERDGADIVGMTGMPEAVLAREIDLEYATIGVIANSAAGKGDSEKRIALEAIEAVLEQAMERVRRVIERLVLA